MPHLSAFITKGYGVGRIRQLALTTDRWPLAGTPARRYATVSNNSTTMAVRGVPRSGDTP